LIIEDIILTDEAREHILSEHDVDQEEVLEVFKHYYFTLKGRQDRHLIFGQTMSGRYLFVVTKHIGNGKAKVITARDMTLSEKKLFKKKRRDKK
jgi:uncharacterized DUF497 family protein